VIGIYCKENEKNIVREFFELFKTPWELYKKERSYDVVIVTEKDIPEINAELLLIYGSDIKQNEFEEYKPIDSCYRNTLLNYNGIEVPIYGDVMTLKGKGLNLLHLKSSSEIAGLQIDTPKFRVLRLGYDLFREVEYLLVNGQPIKNAYIPTLEIHIMMLRNFILNSGVFLIEITPVPSGYDFIACLTHDVDFVKIGNHKLDHSMWGFLYRATISSLLDLLKKRISWSRLLQNWKAIIYLPFIYIGLVKDFWLQFDHYLKIEKNLKSTYFFIPFKSKVGDKVSGQNAYLRAAKYDINNLKVVLNHLINAGNEIAVHGIDAWHNPVSGYYERKKISAFVSESIGGIRIHWLLKNAQTFITLEKAGYIWDSSFGYNETVGYRGGTTQVFKPIGVRTLLELPIHIQDTALFYPSRMDLSEKQALNLCIKLINNASIYGGVITLNWHQRSLGSERLWGDFYLRLLKEIQVRRPWFATAGQAVDWFRKRRNVLFKEFKFSKNKLRLSLMSDEIDIQPPLTIRVYCPSSKKLDKNDFSIRMGNHFDIPWKGKREIEVLI